MMSRFTVLVDFSVGALCFLLCSPWHWYYFPSMSFGDCVGVGVGGVM